MDPYVIGQFQDPIAHVADPCETSQFDIDPYQVAYIKDLINSTLSCFSSETLVDMKTDLCSSCQ